MEYLIIIAIIIAVINGIYNPNTNSSSYKLGKGLGNKTKKLGEWIMKDD